jgi:hypothetical protein
MSSPELSRSSIVQAARWRNRAGQSAVRRFDIAQYGTDLRITRPPLFFAAA